MIGWDIGYAGTAEGAAGGRRELLGRAEMETDADTRHVAGLV